jgi:hypothetical protein
MKRITVLMAVLTMLLGCARKKPSIQEMTTTIHIRYGEAVNLQVDDVPSGYILVADDGGAVYVWRYSGMVDNMPQHVEPVLGKSECTSSGNDSVCSTGNGNTISTGGGK